jgi:hypothetical protein
MIEQTIRDVVCCTIITPIAVVALCVLGRIAGIGKDPTR